MKTSVFARFAIALVILGIAACGWIAFQATRTQDKTNSELLRLSESNVLPNIQTADYKDSAQVYIVKYPKDWEVQKLESGTEGPLPDWTMQSQPVTFIPKGAPDGNGVSIQYIDKATSDSIIQGWSTDKHTIKSTKINGNLAQYTTFTFKGDAEGYTQHDYMIYKGDHSLYISYRSTYHHDNVEPAVSWDQSSNVPGFLTIVNSAKFIH